MPTDRDTTTRKLRAILSADVILIKPNHLDLWWKKMKTLSFITISVAMLILGSGTFWNVEKHAD
jgi:ABC-type proline/glycine betaine transport system permease subunit